MSTNNPFAKHTSNLFASRGCDVDQALTYAHDIMQSLSTESDKTAVMTAIMVLVNTASNAFTQATGPSPAQEVAAAWVRNLVAQEIDKHASTMQDKVGELVTEWIDGNLDGKLDDWANNSLAFEDACDNRVERWIENNLDLSDQIESAINDMDLVVRVR